MHVSSMAKMPQRIERWRYQTNYFRVKITEYLDFVPGSHSNPFTWTPKPIIHSCANVQYQPHFSSNAIVNPLIPFPIRFF